jgi:uroporphyrinogen decarboxylase
VFLGVIAGINGKAKGIISRFYNGRRAPGRNSSIGVEKGVSGMTSRERVLTALKREQPDRVPWTESYVHDDLASALVGRRVKAPPGSRIAPEVFDVLPLDNITYNLRPADYARRTFSAGQDFVGDGTIKTRDDLKKVKLPDLDDPKLYEPAYEYLRKYRAQRAAIANCRFGVANTYLSMGLTTFSYALYDDLKLVETLLDIFTDWSMGLMKRIHALGFDSAVMADDLAMKNAPLFSPQIVREVFLPRMRRVAEVIKIPWVYHSDGNIMPLLDDLLTLGMNGIANIEPGAMDIVEVKKKYGHRICLIGNISLHSTLTMGTPEETEKEVKDRILTVGQGGGYILASANGLTNYCKPENVKAMGRALEAYGYYPLKAV